MRICPKCHKHELDVTVPDDNPNKNIEEDIEDYYFRCWNCGFTCSRKEAEKYSSEAIIISKKKK